MIDVALAGARVGFGPRFALTLLAKENEATASRSGSPHDRSVPGSLLLGIRLVCPPVQRCKQEK